MYLNCHTAFSFRYGTLTVQKLFDEARRCGVHKLILTEINNTASYLEMLRLCHEHRPGVDGLTLYGKESYVLDVAVGVECRGDDNALLYIAIARNNAGFEELNRFLSRYNREHKALPDRAPVFDQVVIIYPLGRCAPEVLRPHEYIGVRPQDLGPLTLYTSYHEYRDRFVALHPVTFASKTDFNMHRLLRAMANNTLLSKLPKSQEAQPDEIMLPPSELQQRYARFPELVANAETVMAQCSLDLLPGGDQNKKHVRGSRAADLAYLTEETWKGFTRRYAHTDKAVVRTRIEKELDIINKKAFASYYLIAYELTQYATQRGYDYVGRGSGANSVVAYCLGITNVDPIKLDLYFERFLNEERSSPPDFDLDFSWDNRDEIYQHLFDLYGEQHVCLLGTHVTYQRRSLLRELGKVFGLPKDEIEALADSSEYIPDREDIAPLILRYAERMKDLPSNMSIHAGGVLITEEPIYRFTTLEFPPKGLPVSHFEMHNAEDFGIFKFDILSQRGLGHLKETVRHVKRNQGEHVDIHQFEAFTQDEGIKDLMRTGRTMGCFYVESPAMRMLLGKLRCDDYLTLVAASSIIRPGVASSGMMRTYLERFHAARRGESYASIHPMMDELMRDTFGVMIYQEDVIKVAHHFAKLTLTEADVLRRGMSGKYRSREEFQRVADRFYTSCRAQGYDEAVIKRVWYEIESFSGYSFAKGHSASYAVESYQSLFLKAHYPLEFMVGVINNFGGFYKTEFYFHEARMLGGQISPPCVNHSEYLTTIEGRALYIGFVHVKSLEERIAREISVERARQGAYTSLDNFLRRLPLGLEQVRVLIRMGAFRFTGKTKPQLLWEAMLFFGQSRTKQPAGMQTLFDTAPKEYPLPTLQRNAQEDAFDEIELLGFPLCDPFQLVSGGHVADTAARELVDCVGKRASILGYVVTTKTAWTQKHEMMYFGTFYDRYGEVFDTVHFPIVAKQFPFRGRGFYYIEGKVVEDFGAPMIEVHGFEKIPMIDKRAELPELPVGIAGRY
ncbi:DNA polymerase III subunit alpha [Parachryseolinea silvisoli]|uniref:DNA polymerase III subunit alpha n=1 Tax=Parachryseolinea silvisoli TaxID=2873601 RepID=UPI002265C308|nr:DNA polymerase III subunit alpha [Parachryseolinea silvisoli]MCD9019710.1 DNA polymerase III subunit alpha [Parachryseolinea silvisoli]